MKLKKINSILILILNYFNIVTVEKHNNHYTIYTITENIILKNFINKYNKYKINQLDSFEDLFKLINNENFTVIQDKNKSIMPNYDCSLKQNKIGIQCTQENKEKNSIIILEKNKDIIAASQLSLIEKENTIQLDLIMVPNEKYLGKGYGKLLTFLNHDIFLYNSNKNIHKITLNNTCNFDDFYTKIGYVYADLFSQEYYRSTEKQTTENEFIKKYPLQIIDKY